MSSTSFKSRTIKYDQGFLWNANVATGVFGLSLQESVFEKILRLVHREDAYWSVLSRTELLLAKHLHVSYLHQ